MLARIRAYRGTNFLSESIFIKLEEIGQVSLPFDLANCLPNIILSVAQESQAEPEGNL